jgi:hypothetical protein
MTPRARRIGGLLGCALLALAGCSSPPFSPFARCEGECPLPPTIKPVANWVHPASGGQIRRTDVLHVTASDNIRIAHVEFFWEGIKVHAGVVAGAPYTVPWDGYPGVNLGGYTDGTPVNFMAIATDVEGNADTTYVTAVFETSP